MRMKKNPKLTILKQIWQTATPAERREMAQFIREQLEQIKLGRNGPSFRASAPCSAPRIKRYVPKR